MAKQSPKKEPAANPIAAALDEARPGKRRTGDGRRTLANAMGNLFLGVVFLSLLAIPGLVYFTDTGAKVKREVRKIVGTMGAGTAKLESELKESREQIEVLQNQITTLQTANAELAAEQREQARRTKAATTASKPHSDEAAAVLNEPEVPKELPRQEYELTRLFNGVGVRTTLDLEPGGSATTERVRPESYEFEMKLKLAVPKAHQSIAELAALNPRLPLMMPELEKLLGAAKVSPLFERLYGLKHERIKTFLTRLDRLETKHNYYDCETMLELTHPGTGKKALLVQGEMDVVADGSDGDRLPEVADYVALSTYYQPTTSYAWTKRTPAANPLQGRLENELKQVEEEYAIKGLTPDRNEHLRNRREELRRVLADMKSRSYLVAEVDPFIVLPLTSVLGQPGAPAIGDYAVVIHEDKAYPVICGDAGPSWKFGEASLLVAKTLDDKSSPYSRPVSDLKVTYLIFPGSAAPEKGPPDLAKWRAKCRELLGGIGGLASGFELHDWRDHVAERRAKRESAGLVDASKSKAAQAAQQAKDAEAQVAKARKLAEEAGKRLQAAKAAPAPAPAAATTLADGAKPAAAPSPAAPDLTKLQAAADAAESKAEEAALAAKASKEAAKRAADLVQQVETAVARLADAVGKPYQTPKTETTDVALAALAEAKQALAKIEEEVKKSRV